MVKTSEFGKGFIYNLVLFAKHWAMMRESMEKMEKITGNPHYDLWFNGASDHFYELEIPKQWEKTEIGQLAIEIQEKALELGHGFKTIATKEDFNEIFEKLEKLCLLIDKELGVKPIKAQWN